MSGAVVVRVYRRDELERELTFDNYDDASDAAARLLDEEDVHVEIDDLTTPHRGDQILAPDTDADLAAATDDYPRGG